MNEDTEPQRVDEELEENAKLGDSLTGPEGDDPAAAEAAAAEQKTEEPETPV